MGRLVCWWKFRFSLPNDHSLRFRCICLLHVKCSFLVCREWKWMKQHIWHIWATSIWRDKKSECLHPFNFHLFNTPWPYFQCRRSFSMKWYEWMKASVLRYELSDVFTPGIWKGNERDVDQPWHRLTYANSWTISVGTNQVDNIHHFFREDASKSWKGNVSILHGFLLRGLIWLQEHREVFQFPKHLSLPALACRWNWLVPIQLGWVLIRSNSCEVGSRWWRFRMSRIFLIRWCFLNLVKHHIQNLSIDIRFYIYDDLSISTYTVFLVIVAS